MFNVDLDTMNITMHRGDTGSFKATLTRETGTEWTSADRALFTIRNQQGEIVLQRYYRLDDQWELGDGVILIEFHNDDTDTWEGGTYNVELRADISPIWEGTAPASRVYDALSEGAPRMVEGSLVRTVIQSTLTIMGVLGDI